MRQVRQTPLQSTEETTCVVSCARRERTDVDTCNAIFRGVGRRAHCAGIAENKAGPRPSASKCKAFRPIRAHRETQEAERAATEASLVVRCTRRGPFPLFRLPTHHYRNSRMRMRIKPPGGARSGWAGRRAACPKARKGPDRIAEYKRKIAMSDAEEHRMLLRNSKRRRICALAAQRGSASAGRF